jgi:competence protein ComEC
VTLLLIPLGALFFQQTSLSSPLANLIAIPLVTYAIVPLVLLATLTGFSWPLPLASGLLALLLTFLESLQTLPALPLASPEPLSVVLAGFGVFWLLAPAMPARWLGLVLLLPIFFPLTPPLHPGEFRLTVLDVGQGQAVLVQTAGHNLLVDAGPDFHGAGDAGERMVVPALRALGVSQIDALVISHADQDHSGGLNSIRRQLPVKHWLASGMTGAPPCQGAQPWVWDGVRILVGARGNAGDNADSCVVRVEGRRGSALVVGDVEGAGEDWLRTTPLGLPATLLVAPHHGSRSSSGPRFVAAIRPAVVVFSVGYGNRFGHPRPEVVARYRQVGADILRTDRDGAVTVDFLADGQHLRRQRQEQPHYWRPAPQM